MNFGRLAETVAAFQAAEIEQPRLQTSAIYGCGAEEASPSCAGLGMSTCRQRYAERTRRSALAKPMSRASTVRVAKSVRWPKREVLVIWPDTGEMRRCSHEMLSDLDTEEDSSSVSSSEVLEFESEDIAKTTGVPTPLETAEPAAV